MNDHDAAEPDEMPNPATKEISPLGGSYITTPTPRRTTFGRYTDTEPPR